jgi:hypothetical protein
MAVETQHELTATTPMACHLTLITKVTDKGLKVTLTFFFVLVQVEIFLQNKLERIK